MKQGGERYLYDGTWEGLLCCVFQCFSLREAPADIVTEQQAQQSLYPSRLICTQPDEAARVAGWLRRLGPDICRLAQGGFLSCLPQREMHILRLLCLARKMGPMAAQAVHDRSVSALRAAAYSAGQEAHLLTGFVRFVEHGGVLTATVSPKNQVLPRLGAHFPPAFPVNASSSRTMSTVRCCAARGESGASTTAGCPSRRPTPGKRRGAGCGSAFTAP